MEPLFKRIILIVLDSVGVGALPDAAHFGDEGANTLGHIQERVGLDLPHLCELGLGEVSDLPGVDQPKGFHAKLAEASPGKDTTTGHWEIAGLISDTPFKTFPNGFPPEVIEPFEKAVGRKVVCNRPASGTEVIKEYGEDHLKTGDLIVYTSADSVFQIAAHEEVIPPRELYEICKKAREILVGPYQVARVIARPFVGSSGNFVRTANRKDFSIEPPKPTLLDKMIEQGLPVIGVGKIGDIFAYRGITYSIKTKSNMDGVDQTLKAMESLITPGLIFTNLVDFDSKFGHRRDPQGYKDALEEFDNRLPEIINALRPGDLLFLTSDHGNDPTHKGTDHTREYIFLLGYYPGWKGSKVQSNLGVRNTFADIGATIGENFGIPIPAGTSFLSRIRPE
ncbi:MAG: phosphopentomutase [Planctomycetota bacterium]|nr:MAG: phosphopentomutase [Planctomycetota bacterium]